MNEPPDVELGPLKLWVHGREFEDDHDYWDGNWFRATALCEERGTSVRVQGAFLHGGQVAEFAKQCDDLHRTLTGQVKLSNTEPNLDIQFAASGSRGGVDVTITITPDHLTQEHRFFFELDQSYLPGFIASLHGILTTYPVRGL